MPLSLRYTSVVSLFGLLFVLNSCRHYLDRHYTDKQFICSGRKVPRTGGIILCNCATKEEATEIIAQDPFYKEQIAKYDIIEFVPTKLVDTFQTIIEEAK